MLTLDLVLIGWTACWIILAFLSFPQEPDARRRLRVLWLLLLPWILAILSGPLVIDHHGASANGRAWMVTGQHVAVALFFVVALTGVLWARGARPCALAICVTSLVPILALAAISLTIIDPGS